MVLQVVVVEYNPQWPSFYEQEKERILSLIADDIIAIEHIGSTSVPGLGAKPVIDMMVGLRSLTEAANCIAPLQSLGYEYVPEFEEIIPERRFFRKYDDAIAMLMSMPKIPLFKQRSPQPKKKLHLIRIKILAQKILSSHNLNTLIFS